MCYRISEKYIKEVITLINTANEKLKEYPTDSEIKWKVMGKYWVPAKLGKKTVPAAMWNLSVDYSLTAHNVDFVGTLTVNENNFYKLEKLNGKIIDCPYYWIKKPLRCECCKVSTNRKYSFVLYDREKEYNYQVGRECLNKFTQSRLSEEIKLSEKLNESILLYNDKIPEMTNDFIPVTFLLGSIGELYERGNRGNIAELVKDIIYNEKTEDILGEYTSFGTVFSSKIQRNTKRLLKFYEETENDDFASSVSDLFKYKGIKRIDVPKVVKAFEYYIGH